MAERPYRLGTVDLVQITPREMLAKVLDRALPQGSHVHFANAYSLVLAGADSRLDKAFDSGVCVVDGLPVIWGLRLCYPRVNWSRRFRISGPDFFTTVMDEGRAHGLRHFLLGGAPETLGLLQRKLVEQFPGVQIVGVISPPYASVDDIDWRPYAREIRDSNADLVWVGLGTPKQDYVASEMARLDQRPYLAVGAAFDFSAGTVRRAPRWMQQLGLEWLFRLVAEPRRLWRRYLGGNSRFLILVAKDALRRRGVHKS